MTEELVSNETQPLTESKKRMFSLFRKNKYSEKKILLFGESEWKKFKRNPLSLIGLLIIILAICISILGYLITPDSTPFANDQKPELHTKPPGFKIKMLKVKKNDYKDENNFFKTLLFGKTLDYTSYPVYYYFFHDQYVTIEGYTGSNPNRGIKVSFNLADVLYSIDTKLPVHFDKENGLITFYTTDGIKVQESVFSLRQKVQKESIFIRTYWLGTDVAGRDMLSRLLIGTRISLSVGFVSVIISVIIGVLLGSLAGYFRGKTDDIIMWIINVVWSIPTLLLVIAITLVLGKGVIQVFIAVGLTMWVDVARVVRGQILSLREKEFIEAARALGFTNGRIILKHILPNIIGPVIVIAASNFATAILTEAGLSFLGIGAQPPTPSWGEMINAHRGYILVDKAYLAFIPGVAIMILVFAFMLVGNGLRDALDSRINEESPPIMQ
ncbi:MAG: ABC transporter permease [Bacteroidia bacterium]|nr:ABC transporter permease [Bacteroidia bacterium]